MNYTLDKAQPIEMDVYNLKGQKVRSLINKSMTAGEHKLSWDGKNDAGNSVANGVYFVKMKSGNAVQTQKLMLLR